MIRDAHSLLCELTSRGLVLNVEGGHLWFKPQSAMTPALLARVKSHKADLMRLVVESDDFPPNESAPANDPDFDYAAARLALAARCNAVLPADVELTAADWKRLDVIDADLAEAEGVSWLFAELCERYVQTLRAMVSHRTVEKT